MRTTFCTLKVTEDFGIDQDPCPDPLAEIPVRIPGSGSVPKCHGSGHTAVNHVGGYLIL